MERQGRRKWEDSGMPIRGFNQLAQCLQANGGVYDTRIGRFMNLSWVVSQQYRYLVDALNRGVLHYPRITEQHLRRVIDKQRRHSYEWLKKHRRIVVDSRCRDIVRQMTQTLQPFPPCDAADAAAYALQGLSWEPATKNQNKE